jgi:hypothetical protein
MRVGAIGVVQARPRGLRGHASATREAHKGRCGYKGSGALAVTKVGRHSPTPSVQAAEQRAFARSERRRGVREGTGGAGRRAAAWRGRPASPIPALTLQGAGVDGSVTSAGGTGGRPKGSARSEMPGRWRARVLSWMGSSSRRGPQFRQARSEMRVYDWVTLAESFGLVELQITPPREPLRWIAGAVRSCRGGLLMASDGVPAPSKVRNVICT